MKETNYQFSLSSADEKTYIGNREITGRDFRVQKDDAPVGKYTNLGIDENTSYSSWAAEAAADSYIASKSNNNQRKRKSGHMLLVTFTFIVAFVCGAVFGFIYADGGWNALLADTKETNVSPQHMTYSEWRAIKRAEEEASKTTQATLTPVAEPASGTILSGSRVTNESELTIKTSNHSCVVKLKNILGETELSFYVRKNTTVTVNVPCEYLYVYFASGETWYGYNHLFGENTAYSKDDKILDFTNYTWEYTLYPVTNGNFTQTEISENEFKE